MESGQTYERAAIERHLQSHREDPLTRDRIVTAPATNRNSRHAVEAWLKENPGVTPEGVVGPEGAFDASIRMSGSLENRSLHRVV